MVASSRVLAVGATTITFATYLIGGGRAFGHDAAITMDQFVRTNSLADPFTRQVVFNNHPLFSLVDHLVYSVSGSTDEFAMRILPVLFAAATVGLVSWWVAERVGLASGVGAALVVAANPLLTSTARDVRGYSLLVLLVTLLGILVERRPTLAGRTAAWATVLIAAALATHLYAVMPISALVVWARSRGALNQRWRTALLVGATAGILPYVATSGELGRGGRVFRATFPAQLIWDLLGANRVSVLALIVLFGLAVASKTRLIGVGRERLLLPMAVLGMVVAVWILAPTDLYPRFFVWVVPPFGAAVGSAIASARSRLLLVGIAIATSLSVQAPTWTKDELANRRIAEELSDRDESEVCSLGTTEGYRVYGGDVVDPPVDRLDACTVVVLLLPSQLNSAPSVRHALDDQFPVTCYYPESLMTGVLRMRSGAVCPS